MPGTLQDARAARGGYARTVMDSGLQRGYYPGMSEPRHAATLIYAIMSGTGPATPLLERLAGEPLRVRALRSGVSELDGRDRGILGGTVAWWRDGVMETAGGVPLARTFLALLPGGPVTGEVLAEIGTGTPAGTALPDLERGYQDALNVLGLPGWTGVAVSSRARLLHGGQVIGYASELFPVTTCEWLAGRIAAPVT